MKLANCRSCHASIIWARTKQGKAIPIDSVPVKNGNLMLVDAGPYPPVAMPGMPAEIGPRYVSHFVTCPEAHRHRKK